MVAHVFVRRGIEAVNLIARAAQDDNDDNPEVRIPPLAATIFLLTCLTFIVLIFCIAYTFGHVVTTLCMIESPETSSYVPVNSIAADEPPAYDEDDLPTQPRTRTTANRDSEFNLVRTKPVTSSLRLTLSHLRSKGGSWSPLRGLGLFIIWGFLRNIIITTLSLIFTRNILFISLAAIISEALLAHLHMTWIHIVISEPSNQRWYNRIPRPTFVTWRKIVPAATLWAATTQVVYHLPALAVGSGHIARMQDPEYTPGKSGIYLTLSQLFGLMLLSVTLFILLEIPAMVTMTRVAASMLPEEDETIVPFDRSYGGKVTPSIIGGEGKIDLVSAWKSFTWNSRRRLVLLCAKVAGVIAIVWLVFTMVVVLEAHWLFGTEAFAEMMKGVHGITRG